MFFIYNEDLDEAQQLYIESTFSEESIAMFAEYQRNVIYFQAWLTTDDPDRPIDFNEIAWPEPRSGPRPEDCWHNVIEQVWAGMGDRFILCISCDSTISADWFHERQESGGRYMHNQEYDVWEWTPASRVKENIQDGTDDDLVFNVGQLPGSMWRVVRNVWVYHEGTYEPYQPHFNEKELQQAAEDFPKRIFFVGGVTSMTIRPKIKEKA